MVDFQKCYSKYPLNKTWPTATTGALDRPATTAKLHLPVLKLKMECPQMALLLSEWGCITRSFRYKLTLILYIEQTYAKVLKVMDTFYIWFYTWIN